MGWSRSARGICFSGLRGDPAVGRAVTPAASVPEADLVCDVANELGCDRCYGWALGWGGPEPEMGRDLLDDVGLLDERDEPHGSVTARALEGIDLVHLLDAARPGAFRGGGGQFGEALDGLSLLSRRVPPFARAHVVVETAAARITKPALQGDVQCNPRTS